MEVLAICPTDAEPVASDLSVSLPDNVVYNISPEPTFKVAPGERFTLPVPVIVGLVLVPTSFTVKALLTVRVCPVRVKVGSVLPVFGPKVIELTVTAAAVIAGCLLLEYATTPICTRSVATGAVPKLQLPVLAHFVAFIPPADPVQLFTAPTAIRTMVVPLPLALVAVMV